MIRRRVYIYLPQAGVDRLAVKHYQTKQARNYLARARELGRELAERDLAEMFGASRQYATLVA